MNWHVIPNNDMITHQESTSCDCNPRVIHVNGNMVVVHNAFDGREGIEWVNEILTPKPNQ